MQNKQNATLQKSTLMSFVKQNCNNFFSDECLGVNVNGNRLKKNSKTFILPQCPYDLMYPNTGPCWIQEGIPCDYFERTVLPQKGNNSIVEEYRKMCECIKKHKPRFCECGAELVNRRRYCDRCKVIKRKKAYRKYNRNRRV